MGKDVKITVQGLADIKKALSGVQENMRGKALLAVHKAGGNIVKRALEQAAPDDARNTSADKLERGATVVKGKTSPSSAWVGFKKKFFYVMFLERGTKKRNTKGKGRYKKEANRGEIVKRPFVGRTHYRAFPKVTKFLEVNYWKLITKALKRG